MKTKFRGLLTLVMALMLQMTFAQHKVTGTVTDAATGEPLPGVNILIEGTNKGTVTDFDGKYSIVASPDDVLVFSYVGYQEVKEKVGNRNVINVALQPGEQLEEVVVDISGEKREVKVLSYAVQQVKSDKLEISDISNVASALSGKFAGAQVADQAGSKLGSKSKIRIRGRISLSEDKNPLYVIDGITIDPEYGDIDIVDPDDIASIEILKGPNATAIYGQRGENGVIVITTKSAKKGTFGIDVNSKVTFEKIAYLPKYQDYYGQGYAYEDEWMEYNHNDGVYSLHMLYDEWAAPEFQGANFIRRTYADESWGPKFDGRDYMPWYAWVPGSPYFGQTAKWVSQPDNVKQFFNTGIYMKNNVALYSGTDKYKARVSFSNIDQKGVIPFSYYNRYTLTGKFNFDVTEKLKLGISTIFSQYKYHGDFNDAYANQVTGSFNQWFARQIDMSKQKELMDLHTPEGYLTSWNWWGPFYGNILPFLGIFTDDPEQFKKPVFWFNPYTWLDRYDRNTKNNALNYSFDALYKFNDNLSAKVVVSRHQYTREQDFHLPYEIEYSSAHEIFMSYVNSFGLHNTNYIENNYSGFLLYNNDINDDWSIDMTLGTNYFYYNRKIVYTWMDYENPANGLVLPDVYLFTNTKTPIPPTTDVRRKKMVSLFGRTTLGYKDMLFIEASGRKDWSSALFPDNNGYFYPSLGITFNFTELDAFQDMEKLSYGKFRFGWAQVGSDVAAHRIYPTYRFLSDVPYAGNVLLVTPPYSVDPNLHPAINSTVETGLDLRFFDNRFGIDFTYYYEKRQDEIIMLKVSDATGYSNRLTNGGTSHRSGIELTLNGTPYVKNDFKWDVSFNFARNRTIVDDIPGENKEMLAPGGRWWSGGDYWSRILLVHREGEEWGQIRGYAIKRDKDGNPYLTDYGYYVTTDSMIYYGSVLPRFTGGLTNSFKYKNLTVTAHLTFQKGGKFYSGSEVWGWHTGLYEETGMNGNREAGMDVSGVDADGNPVTINVQTAYAYSNHPDELPNYFQQFHDNNLVEFFIHDASYLKLRELSLNYAIPKKYLGKYLKGANIGIVGTNVWLIAVSKDNYHRWDPSELSQIYGEDGQLPGTRRIGMNIKLSF